MNTDAQHRRLTRIALEAARMNGSPTGSNFRDYLGNFDHIEFKKSEAGDYRAVILGAEISLGNVIIEDAVRVHKRPRWTIYVRPETCKNRINHFDPIRTEAGGMPPISKTLRGLVSGRISRGRRLGVFSAPMGMLDTRCKKYT